MVCFVDGVLDGIVAFEGKSSMVLQERVVSKGKNKPKRPPQRGLGVAQLEKLRLQEQQKNLTLTSSAFLDPNPMFRSSVNQNQPNSWERSSLSHKTLQQQQQQQHDLSNALLVSKSLTPSSSGVHLQMEPPSNQSYCSNYTNVISSWPEEDTNLVEMIGMKRSCPFQVENLHSSYPCKVPSFLTTLREGSSISMCKKDDGDSDGGFLSLGPSLAPSVLKSKQFMAFSTTKHSQQSDLNLPPYRKNAAIAAAAEDGNDAFKLSFGNSAQSPPYYAFFPVGPNTQEAMLDEQSGEILDGIDLNLKL